MGCPVLRFTSVSPFESLCMKRFLGPSEILAAVPWVSTIAIPPYVLSLYFLEYTMLSSRREVNLNQQSWINEGLDGFMGQETLNVNISVGIFALDCLISITFHTLRLQKKKHNDATVKLLFKKKKKLPKNLHLNNSNTLQSFCAHVFFWKLKPLPRRTL